ATPAADATVVTLTAPEATIYVDYIAQNVSFSVASTTTEADAATITASCATAGIDSSPSVSGDVVTVALAVNESTTSSITHSVIVTATLNGVAVSKVVTIVQSATPTADATVVTLTAPEATISVDAAEQKVSFSVASTTTEAEAASISASCATATVEIAESGDVTVALVVNESTTSSITHSVIVTATSNGVAVSKVVTIEQAAAIAADATVVTLSVPGSPISVPSYSKIYSLDVYGTTTEESGSLTFTAESASDGIKALTITDGSTTDNTTAVLKIEYDTNLSDEAITFIVKVTATSTDGTSKSAFITYVQNAYAEGGTPAVNFAADPDAPYALNPSVLYNETSATMSTTSNPENTIAASVAYTAEYSAGWITGYSYDATTGKYTFTVSELATLATTQGATYTQESYTYNSDRTAEVTLVATTSEGVTEKLSATITQQAYYYSLYYSSEEGSVYTSASETVTADATSLTVSNVVLVTNSLATPDVTSNADVHAWITGVTYNNDSASFTVTMEQNTTTIDRTATLVVSIEVDGVTKSLQIVVTQEATTASITISGKGESSDNPATTSRGSNSVDISLSPSTSVSSFLNTNNNNIKVTTSIVSVTNVVTGDVVLGSNDLTVSYTYNGNYTISLGNMRNGLNKDTTYAVKILITSTSVSGRPTTNLSETITVYVKVE
ncbi:MAG: hypothetical protein SNG79_03010, partial [Rikenellaceae bacterium]